MPCTRALANFVLQPDNLVGGTFDFGGVRIEASRLLGGVLALVITAGMHLVLTRTALGSRMQAIAWGIGAASPAVGGRCR